MRRRRHLLLLAACAALPTHAAFAQDDGVSTLKGLFARLESCWRPPPMTDGRTGFQITVLFSFKRDGTILGRPKVTFETAGASDDDRIAYRTAVLETLQRCTPMPFSGGLGDAVAGRPFRVRFDDRRSPHQPAERKA